jgi:hypothetical protein
MARRRMVEPAHAPNFILAQPPRRKMLLLDLLDLTLEAPAKAV